jgi:hypothetical protein
VNGIGYTSMSLPKLKVLQEVIALLVFAPFALLYMRQPLSLKYLWAALCLVGAVYFIFREDGQSFAMSRVFEFKLNRDRDGVLKRMRMLAREHNMICEGDDHAGIISGMGFQGRYEFQQSSVIVTIEQKPRIVPWSFAEKEISTFFSG